MHKFNKSVKTPYILKLSEEEKDVLICILESVGGARETSPRKFSESVYNKLKGYKTTITYPECDYGDLKLVKYQDLWKDPNVGLWFNDFPQELEDQPPNNSLQLKAEIDFSDAKKDIEELTELLKQVEVIKNRIFKE